MKTVKQIKGWLSEFPDDTEVVVTMDCLHGIIELVVYRNCTKYRFELTEPKQPSSKGV